MRRFFRSAAFPILIVIVLAFFAQRLLNDSEPEKPPPLSEFQNQVRSEPSAFDEVTFQPKSNTIKVQPTERQRVLDRLSGQLRDRR